jgi:CheY-like chemotaxis protein
MGAMGTQSTLLCIHRDPGKLLHLEENGYRLLTATNGSEGLRLLMSRTVDAVVIEYHLGLLDGATVASEIKQVRPQVPIVMVCDNLELPDDALKSVDAFVIRSDGHPCGHHTFRAERGVGQSARWCCLRSGNEEFFQPFGPGPATQNNHLARQMILTGNWGRAYEKPAKQSSRRSQCLGIKAALKKLVCGVVVGVCASTLPTRGTRLG